LQPFAPLLRHHRFSPVIDDIPSPVYDVAAALFFSYPTTSKAFPKNSCLSVILGLHLDGAKFLHYC